MFCQHYETTALDASLLLMPLLRFLPKDDPRIRSMHRLLRVAAPTCPDRPARLLYLKEEAAHRSRRAAARRSNVLTLPTPTTFNATSTSRN